MLGAPRTDPYVRHYLIRLLPRMVARIGIQPTNAPSGICVPGVAVSVYLARFLPLGSPWPVAFPPGHPHPAAGGTCSAPSSVLLHGPTARERACRHYTFSASPTDPRSSVDTPELSQFTYEKSRRVHGVYDPGDPPLDSRLASFGVLPSLTGKQVGNPNVENFVAQYPARVCLCQRFATASRQVRA